MRRTSWTDERMDDFARGIDRGFDQVDQRLEQVDRRLDRIDDSVRHLTTTLMLAGGGVLAAIVGGIATGAIGS